MSNEAQARGVPTGGIMFGGDGQVPGFTGLLDLVRVTDGAIHPTEGFYISRQ